MKGEDAELSERARLLLEYKGTPLELAQQA